MSHLLDSCLKHKQITFLTQCLQNQSCLVMSLTYGEERPLTLYTSWVGYQDCKYQNGYTHIKSISWLVKG